MTDATNAMTLGLNKAQKGAQMASALAISKASIEKTFVETELKTTQMGQETVANGLKVMEKAASSINF